MRIIIRGVSSNSGFGQAVQGLIKVSQHAGFDTRFIPVNAHLLQHRTGFSVEDLARLDSININPYIDSTKNDIIIEAGSLVCGVNSPELPCKRKIFYTTYETIQIHWDYINAFNSKFSELWTTSNFNKTAFLSSRIEIPVKILPCYVDSNQLNPDALPLNIKNKRGFSFLYNADVSFRKGLHYLIPSFCKEFKADEDVCLILKLIMSDPTSKAAPHIVESINRLLLSANQFDEPRPPILLMIQFLDYPKLSNLYSTCDCYVAPYMAEGFGYPIAEAMMCRKPVIASRCSAPLDYLDDTNALFIELNAQNPTVPITDPWQLKIDPKYEGQRLYHIDSASLRKQMRFAFENREILKQKGEKARTKILDF
jgi:glycosyltransferase involved in cell wall biosynthesis